MIKEFDIYVKFGSKLTYKHGVNRSLNKPFRQHIA